MWCKKTFLRILLLFSNFIIKSFIFQNNDASVVRILDRGMLADQDGNGMEFVVLEKAQMNLRDWLEDPVVKRRQLKVIDVSIYFIVF